ncbi:hypothetical protein E1295_27955 [Nonomuraea mesophila]|uniref:DUF7144 domain-containing protein n=1 Tax=Nonomuraea mesophila TaxID=2530382 RepID=A0A4R5F4K3_9ACTN|nr:hypothetical protein E1295_27955 [Nonomuraea mesophila]
MPEQASRPRTEAGRAPASRPEEEARPSGWLGWVIFAGIGMIILGCFQAMMGLVGLFNTDFYLVTADNLAIPVNYTAWGWFHLIMGVVVLLAGAAVMSGKTWGRVVGIVLASLQALVNFAWFPAYPFWSTIVIIFDVLVIYALAVHGREMKSFGRSDL